MTAAAMAMNISAAGMVQVCGDAAADAGGDRQVRPHQDVVQAAGGVSEAAGHAGDAPPATATGETGRPRPRVGSGKRGALHDTVSLPRWSAGRGVRGRGARHTPGGAAAQYPFRMSIMMSVAFRAYSLGTVSGGMKRKTLAWRPQGVMRMPRLSSFMAISPTLLARERLLGLAVGDDLDADHQTVAAHVADALRLRHGVDEEALDLLAQLRGPCP